jgi:hypothetical protein
MPATRFVATLPDLVSPEEYANDPQGRRVRVRITATAGGVEIVGDGPRPVEVDRMLAALGAPVIDKLLCG